MEQKSHSPRESGHQCLHQLDTHKSMEPDRIHTWVLRELAKMLNEVVSTIYQESCLTGEVPFEWRLEILLPSRRRAGGKFWETRGLSI